MAHMAHLIDQLYDFIVELSVSYHNGNPYHNFAHAVDVLQCCYYFLGKLGLVPFPNQVTRPQDLLRPNDVFALLIAALGHDAAHPGVNNMFMVHSFFLGQAYILTIIIITGELRYSIGIAIQRSISS